MRAIASFLVAVLWLSQTGCTITFGVAGAMHAPAELEGPIPPETLNPYAPIVLVTTDGKQRTGYWLGIQQSTDDTTRVIVLDRRPNGMHEYPLAQVRGVYWPHYGPKTKGALIGAGFGLAVDLVLVGAFAYALTHSCAFDGCREDLED
ncbi:MAG TPA: hypothetical protein VD948_06020 [Rhodothermales bacterium]|nr:hypothetical protein [Rhodothermales bacterium]